jgi:hypothetical protein
MKMKSKKYYFCNFLLALEYDFLLKFQSYQI